jgi:hypothetical protein
LKADPFITRPLSTDPSVPRSIGFIARWDAAFQAKSMLSPLQAGAASALPGGKALVKYAPRASYLLARAESGI